MLPYNFEAVLIFFILKNLLMKSKLNYLMFIVYYMYYTF